MTNYMYQIKLMKLVTIKVIKIIIGHFKQCLLRKIAELFFHSMRDISKYILFSKIETEYVTIFFLEPQKIQMYHCRVLYFQHIAQNWPTTWTCNKR